MDVAVIVGVFDVGDPAPVVVGHDADDVTSSGSRSSWPAEWSSEWTGQGVARRCRCRTGWSVGDNRPRGQIELDGFVCVCVDRSVR
jgi:hypothetical protein